MSHAQEILRALKCATDQNPSVLKPAEEWLKKLECDGDFHVTLSEISCNQEIEWTIRWLAVVYLKNGIDKYWRPNLAGSLASEKKSLIRHNLCRCLEEPVDQVAIQCAVIIARIARLDYPKDWNELIPLLLAGLSAEQSILHQKRSLLTLKHVIKMLSVKRLPNAKEVFSGVCNDIFKDIFALWIARHDALKQEFKCNENEELLKALIENQLLLTNVVSYIIVNSRQQNIQELYDILLRKISEDISFAEVCKNHDSIGQNSAKIVITMIKIMESILFADSEYYKIAAERTLNMLCNQIHSSVNHKYLIDEYNEKFLVKCLNLVKAISDDERFGDVFFGRAENDHCVNQYIENLFQYLISHYLPLTMENLESWQDDPESFSNEEVGECWKFNLRPSAEVLVLTLLRKFPDTLVPRLLSMLDAVQDLDIHNVSSIQSTGNPLLPLIMESCTTPLECMVRKEAIYYTIGLGVFQVMDCIDFENWLSTKLMPEVKSIQGDVHSKLIHRRVLCLISQWAGVKPSDELRPVLYAFVVSSLDASLDMAVRLAASVTLQNLLDDFEFDILVFKEQQDACFQGLYALLLETESCDTKMRVLNVFSYLIERLGQHIIPYERKIAAIVPSLWDHAMIKNHNMLKCAILSTMIQFIAALGANSSSVNHLTIPLIEESTNLSNASHIYLLEDGLELWLATLQNCTEMNENLFAVFNNIFGLLEYGSETLRICFSIIEAYVLLVGEGLIAKHGAQLDHSFSSLATDVRNECLVLVSKLVSIIIEVLPPMAHGAFALYCRDALGRVFYEKDSLLLSANLTLLAQIILQNSSYFWQFLHEFSEVCGNDFNQTVQSLIKVWCESIDTIVEVDKRKLSSLALLTMLGHVREIPIVANSFNEIACVSVQVLYDVCDEHHIDMLLTECDQDVFESEQEQEECPHDKRKRLLRKQTAVVCKSLPAFASDKLKLLQQQIPQHGFAQLMSTVNAGTLQELRQFLASY